MNSNQTKRGMHPAAEMHARELCEGKITRREFLARSTALGLSVGTAYGMLGEAGPAYAQDATPKQGGTLRIQMDIKGLKEPRVYDWSQIANITRGTFE